jgi:hypothetical protein
MVNTVVLVVDVVAVGVQRSKVPVPLAVLTLPSVSMAVMTTVITALVALSLGRKSPLNGPIVPEYSSSTFDSRPLSSLPLTCAS